MDRSPHTRPLNRRRFLGASAGAAAGLIAGKAGVLAQDATPAVGSAASLGKDFGGVTIRIATIAEYYAHAFRMFQDQVEQELGVTLSIEVVPAADLYARNMQDYVGGSTSYDVAFFLPYQLPDYAPHLDPIGDLMAQYELDPQLDDILPAFKNFYTTWAGKHMTVPFDGDHHLMLYNKDAFENADLQSKFESENGYPLAVPETYDQYLAMAKFFQENPWRTDGGTGYGVAEGYLEPSWWFENRLASSGAVYFDEEMNPLINTPNAIMAAQNLVDLAPFNPPGSNTFGYQEVENAIAQGDVALSINWSSAFRTSMDPNKSKVVGKIGTAVTPGFMVNGELVRHDALCTGWVLGIPTYGPNKEAATYVAWFYSQPDVHTAMILDPNTGVDAYRLSSIQDPAFAEKYGADFVTTIEDSITVGFPDLQVPNAFEYYTSLNNQLREAVTGGKSVEDAMNQVAAEWNEITDRMGREAQAEAWNTAYTAMKDAGITYIPLS
ncbi:MAG: extracellular solute-binding protein [Thermomicrobiales bacterium]|nr:extracellular solute-binding protein [Thermomicrobiales bacterium]